MLLRSIAVAVAASVAGVLAAAPASAAPDHVSIQYFPPGNCPQGTFCIWPTWEDLENGPAQTPSLVTTTEWTGNVAGWAFYNHTSRNAEITWAYTYIGTPLTGKLCATPGWGGDTYVPMRVTKVSWQTTTC